MKKLLKNKVFLIISGVLLVCIIGIIVGLILFLPKNETPKKSKEKNKKYTIEEIVENSIKDGSLIKDVKSTLKKYEDFNTKNVKIKIGEMDINSDNNKDIVAYAEDNNDKKVVLVFDVNEDKNTIINTASYGAENDVLGYAYSKKDDKNYWYVDSNGANSVYVIKEDSPSLVVESDFKNDYYEITNKYDGKKIIDRFVEVDLENKTINKDKLLDNNFTNEELLENNNITQEQIKENANKKEEPTPEESPKETVQNNTSNSSSTDTLTINGHTLHYGKYSADPFIFYENIQIDKGGSANADGVSCTWTKESHDFAQDESSAGHPKECIVLVCGSSTDYLTSFQNDQLSDGDIMNFNYAG